MALRAHEELAPTRIKPAVERGLKFVLDEAPKMELKDYAIWTWSFSIAFLADEFGRTKDASQKKKLLECIKVLADKIVKAQRPGAPDLPTLPAKTPRDRAAKDPKPSWTEKPRESEGGSIGAEPAIENEPVGGVLIQKVTPGGPADKAGIKAGDRIFEIDGHEINGMGHLLDLIDSSEPGTKIKVRLRRGVATGGPKVPDDGGWSYYAWSESMTFTTATTILALLDAKALGVDIPQGELDRAVRMLESAHYRYEDMSEDGFVYRLHANKGIGKDIRAAIGRVAVCTMALLRAGKATESDLSDAVDTFVRRRGELDRVRGYPGNHVIRSYANAAYYFLYGHYNTAAALASIKDAAQKKRCGIAIQEALLSIQWKEGTWTDHQAWGELYGTAMALMALGKLKFVTPDAYKTPISKLQTR
jgi:hypothetical protein